MIRAGYLFGSALIVLAAALLVVAGRMSRFKNQAEFERLHEGLGLHYEDDREFERLLVMSRTNRTALENYGVTLMICGFGLPGVLTWRANRGPVFSTQGHLVLCGVTASVTTVLAEAAKVLLASARQEFPWWHNSILYRIGPLPVMFFMLLVWMLGHSFFASGALGKPRGPGFELGKRWLIFLRAGAVLSMGLALVTGDFLSLISRGLWLLFYHATLCSHIKTGRIIYF